MQPLEIEGINMVAELNKDEEESLSRRNPSLVPLFEADVVGIVKEYTKNIKPQSRRNQNG